MYDDKDKRYFDYPSMTWSEAWTRAISDPSDRTYEAIITDPQATAGRAFGWVAAAAAVAAVINAFGLTLFSSNAGGSIVTALLCAVPVSAVAAVIGLAIGGVIVNIIAKAMDGRGTFDELINGFAAVQSPMAIIGAAINLIPALGWILSIPLGLYSIYLILKVTTVVHEIGWMKAFVANFAILFLFACCIIALLGTAGASISDVFADIQSTLEAGQ